MAFKKNFTCATFENAKKYHMSYSQLCTKYALSDEELEQAIRNVFHKRKADEMIRIFREQDEKARKPKPKKTQSLESEQVVSKASDTVVVPEPEIAHMGIIEVNEITPDNVGEVVAAIDEVMAEQPKSTLEVLQKKERALSERLALAKCELDKRCGIKAEITNKLQSLADEVRDLRNTIEQKIAEVSELRDYSGELDNLIIASEHDVESLQKELMETKEAIKVEQVITITALSDGWFKFEPESVDIPNVEVSAEKLSEAAAQFAGDERFEDLTIKNIRQLLLLEKMVQAIKSEHPNIEVQFESNNLRTAWENWKGESI